MVKYFAQLLILTDWTIDHGRIELSQIDTNTNEKDESLIFHIRHNVASIVNMSYPWIIIVFKKSEFVQEIPQLMLKVTNRGLGFTPKYRFYCNKNTMLKMKKSLVSIMLLELPFYSSMQ